MFGLSNEILGLIAVAFIAGGIIKGITGLALPIVSLAISINFLDPKIAIALLVLPILVTNGWQAFRTGLSLRLISRFRLMIFFFIITLILSALMVVELETSVLFFSLGTAVTIFSFSNLLFSPNTDLLICICSKLVWSIK